MGYSIDPVSENCYPGTSVLVNKLGIRDESVLLAIEGTVTTTKGAQWIEAPCDATFDFEHYKSIHRFLFSDLYDWAGTVRKINMSKKGTRFCDADQIESEAERVFSHLRSCDYFRGLKRKDYILEFTDFYQATNFLHPFREGNGRTQRIFLQQLLRLAGYDIEWTCIDADLLMIATIQAAQGVTDLLKSLFDEEIFQR